jgi:hypothetical protein
MVRVGPALGSGHPGGGPAARHVTGRQRLTLRERRPPRSIIDFLAVKGQPLVVSHVRQRVGSTRGRAAEASWRSISPTMADGGG